MCFVARGLVVRHYLTASGFCLVWLFHSCALGFLSLFCCDSCLSACTAISSLTWFSWKLILRIVFDLDQLPHNLNKCLSHLWGSIEMSGMQRWEKSGKGKTVWFVWLFSWLFYFVLFVFGLFCFFPLLPAIASVMSKWLWNYSLILSFVLGSGFSNKANWTAMATNIEYNLLKRWVICDLKYTEDQYYSLIIEGWNWAYNYSKFKSACSGNVADLMFLAHWARKDTSIYAAIEISMPLRIKAFWCTKSIFLIY